MRENGSLNGKTGIERFEMLVRVQRILSYFLIIRTQVTEIDDNLIASERRQKWMDY